MPFEYINRKGDSYYLYEGRTPTGRLKYFFSRNLHASAMEVVPAGYEVWESLEGGLVYLRRIQPVLVTLAEREMVVDGIRQYSDVPYFLVDAQRDSIIVYLPTADVDGLIRETQVHLRISRAEALNRIDSLVRRSPYMKMMRFQLEDVGKRVFNVQRWCFRGRIDDWVFVDGPAPLKELVVKYANNLGQPSFFDLV